MATGSGRETGSLAQEARVNGAVREPDRRVYGQFRMKLTEYRTEGYFDELFGDGGAARAEARPLLERLRALDDGELLRRQRAAESAMFEAGTTFHVYGDEHATERIIPFDIVPRIVEPEAWDRVERGLRQRIAALQCFIGDALGPEHIVRDGIVPRDVIPFDDPVVRWCKETGARPPKGIYCPVSGIDLVRDERGSFVVLEDNLRCPSGVSYVLENRQVLKQTFPRLFDALPIRSVDDYAERLLITLAQLAPDAVDEPRIVVMTPGRYNAAYFEHAYLAQQMGVPLVEACDLLVDDGLVKMRTTHGPKRVDVIYRRVNDDYMDPTVFRPESLLGVPGIMEVYRRGRVALANAPGAGVADNKVIYAFVPEMIRYYLREDPVLPNVTTYLCGRETDRAHVLNHLDELVVKPASESGGKGILVGPHATEDERREMAKRIAARPNGFIAQPTICLSRVPTVVDGRLEGRHVDLRPFVLQGESVYVLPGGLTRVALEAGSLTVNSSQGGGTKDTWVLARSPG